MTMAQADWEKLSSLQGQELKSGIFSVLQAASVELQEGSSDNPQILAAVPRLADFLMDRPELSSFAEAFGSLARSVGLWNYIDKESADRRDRLVAESATIEALGNITLHKEQVAALNILLRGQNLILSAPTSFGKSILIDVLLLSGKYRRVAIVLPTIALLDEFRRRLVERFGDSFDVLMHHSEKIKRANVIFLGTQERLINREDLGKLDLVVVDEFYKLDPSRKDERSVTLNAAVYQLLGRAKQFFFLGPNIEAVQISNDSRWRFEFLKTRFSTVAVNTYDLKNVADKEQCLREEAYNEANWPALIFVSSPDKANKLAESLVGQKRSIGDGRLLAEWIEENYGGRWELSETVAVGIGIHHGRIPRALASRFVKMFNDGSLPILICTSTLIEGVNTAAKSVLIFDKTIAKQSYDYFTFSNIKGRAGRLGQHHVGQVFLFHAPPEQEDVEVTAPLFGDLDDVPDEFVVHIRDEDATPSISGRIDDLGERLGLSSLELRRVASLGIETLLDLRTQVGRASDSELAWAGFPDYSQILSVCEVICEVRPASSFGVYSAKQLSMYLNQLRRSDTMRAFFNWHSKSYRGDIQKLDNVFKFLRACEYSLPELLSAVQLFCNKAKIAADYSLFIAELPRWFRAEALKNLEEEGVPIQISERVLRKDDSAFALGQRLRQLAQLESSLFSSFERDWILEALPR
ncbi:DEAD/DEAH box helicase [Bradyrhizobium diazoefficiens]|uniref:DEAD/DEAH box helicase n=1 Tax=Bradyrhizobium diazoefficiens TaxID=1355477 RepID=A0A810BRC0_9BRAD|nr:hypothetical protein XF9B_09030 [Bradyrhizobium diazoefficiens]BCE96882.1 hypothetical protein XF11B_09030 [Bradyrhizobium diazoefficiens]BCF05533.1 hypothetical protein XF12B_09060 [Bradyrhizobium diazoefficiens]BCF57953.1 hypothetical protein XF18B_09010 [Bradyrhizobium diazoefficiens]